MFKKILSGRLVTNNVNGLKYKLIHPIEKKGEIDNLNWEPILGEELFKVFKDLDNELRFLDVGAAFGVFSLLASNQIPGARVVSIEPYWLRRYVLRINCLLKPNISVFNYFIGDVNFKKTMTIQEFCTMNNFIPNVIKMDIEGFEYEALLGSIEFLSKYKPIIFFEFHRGIMDRMGKDHSLLLLKLKEIGYELAPLDHHMDEMESNFLYRCS